MFVSSFLHKPVLFSTFFTEKIRELGDNTYVHVRFANCVEYIVGKKKTNHQMKTDLSLAMQLYS